MTDSERLSRETFYQNLICIVDGRGFRKNFEIYHLLPYPQSELARPAPSNPDKCGERNRLRRGESSIPTGAMLHAGYFLADFAFRGF